MSCCHGIGYHLRLSASRPDRGLHRTRTINRDAFEIYIAKVLVPELEQGDIVVMNNLSSHKGRMRCFQATALRDWGA